MQLILSASSSTPPLGAIFVSSYINDSKVLSIKWSDAPTSLAVDGKSTFTSCISISQYLSRVLAPELYGNDSLSSTEVNHWINVSCVRLAQSGKELLETLKYINQSLATSTYLVGNSVSLADIHIFAALFECECWRQLKCKENYPHLKRWFSFMSQQDYIVASVSRLPSKYIKSLESSKNVSDKSASTGNKDEGKFIDLEGAEMGKVIVRFPPEASGYLHIGHAKAALLNQYYQKAFKGKLIMRFDDTNPAKEKLDFEKVILEDLKLLKIEPDLFTHTSDHFDVMLEFCENLIKEGRAYVDNTDPEMMKSERENRTDSKNRNNSVENNIKMWNEMKKSTEYGKSCCVRAKIDMKSDNGCMRDPAIYRCKDEPHVRTGSKYKVYPTYDFACPIVDSLELVTHALRTTEYQDRDDQYHWFIDALGLRKPHIWAYSRLNMMYTVLSKRKLTWFVDQNIVTGWDDPRFPTVRGVLRRGMTVEGLKQFIVAQGSSRSVVVMDWDKIWAFNKKVIDPIAPRYTALQKDACIPVFINGVQEEVTKAQKHPKDASIGMKNIWLAPKVWIEACDAENLKEDENATFINWGNLKIKKINRNADNKIESIEADSDLDNKDYKKTQKLTWLADTDKAPKIPCVCVYFDNIISKGVLGKDDDFKDFVNHDTKFEVLMVGDPDLANVKKSEVIQIQRKGFFICDEPYEPANRHSCRESPVILFAIPDGSSKQPQGVKFGQKRTNNVSAKETLSSAQGKSAEKSPQEVTSKTIDGKLNVNELAERIENRGNKIRELKSSKATKEEVTAEVSILLKLKADFKIASGGQDWKPGVVTKSSDTVSADVIDSQIVAQGDYIRKLKADKADKLVIDQEVRVLLTLKAKYKEATNTDWKPGVHVSSSANNKSQDLARNSDAVEQKKQVLKNERKKAGSKSPDKSLEMNGNKAKNGVIAESQEDAVEMKNKIDKQGEIIRDLKSAGASKDEINKEVETLLLLKTEYKNKTGVDLTGGASSKKSGKKDKAKQEKKDTQKKENPTDTSSHGMKKVTRLGLEATKEENLSEWYSQTITKAEMIEYYDISGCYILRPWAYSIWEKIQAFLDAEIKKLGVQNTYFPMFVSHHSLEKEKNHIGDFAPEVAWVTKSGDTDLAEPIAIRPTSETVMYPTYAKWIQSHRDLPLKLNQWCNVVRWEFKHPQPFLRTREFLWQEGHTAFATKEEAVEEVYQILDIYSKVYSELLAIPVIKGKKSEKEKFAGSDFSTTTEVYVSASGRAIQGSTSHHLGQNFSKMMEIVYEKNGEKEYVFQNSWGLTTRTIGVMTMVHGDNTGLVLPPAVACYQAVIIPCGITASLSDADKEKLLDSCVALEKQLKDRGIRVYSDLRDNYSPGWKFNHWELKGVPIRIELGPRDVKQEQYVAVRRDNGEKVTANIKDARKHIGNLLEIIQKNLYDRAKAIQERYIVMATSWTEFCDKLEAKCLIHAPFCGEVNCEENVKKDSARDESIEPGAPSMGAKSLCIPFDQPAKLTDDMKCVHPKCGKKAKYYVLFGRSY